MSIDISRAQPHVAVVTIDNPAQRNALGPQEFRGLADAWQSLAADRDVRCIVVTGGGTQAFCSGAALNADFSGIDDVDEMVDAALCKTRLLRKPLIAAVNGHCVAGGFELMMASDIRIASAAARIGLPEVHWGILPSGGAAMKLIDQIGHARAMQLLLTGELIDADTALAFGIINRVVAPPDVLETALAMARTIAGNSPLAVQLTKESALAHRCRGWQALEAQERVRADTVRASPDFQIGRRAFLSKTVPDYPSV